MPVWLSFLAVFAGLGLLVGGGEMLVSGAVRLARRLGMSSLLIGLTIVAFGTSVPELFISLTAALQGFPDIMIGNVVGSNIANIGFILGFSLLFYPIRVRFGEISRELYLVIGVSCILAGIAFLGYFPRPVGAVFVIVIVWYTWLLYRGARNKKNENNYESKSDRRKYSPLWLIIALCVGGLFLLAVGSDIFISGAVKIARFFGVSELLIGLTLAAVGTSLPEFATSISSIRRRQSDILVGNVVGSNLFNLLMVMGSTGLIAPFSISRQVLIRDIPVMILFAAALVPFIRGRKRMNRLQGVVLVVSYVGYIVLLSW